MTRCSIFLVATIFFLVGICFAVAEEPADEDARRETTYTFVNPSTANVQALLNQYFFNTPRDIPLTITLPRYRGVAEIESLWSFYSVGYQFDDLKNLFDETLRPGSAQTGRTVDGRGVEAAGQANPSASPTGNEPRVYDLSCSFANSVTYNIGLAGRDDYDVFFRFRAADADAADDSLSSDDGTASILKFEKTLSNNGENGPRIMSGGSYGNDISEGDGYYGTPLSTPLTMLLLLIGFFIVVVMYTTVGIKLKD